MAILPNPERLLTELATPLVMARVVKVVDALHPPADFKPAKLFVMIGGGKGSGKSVLNELVAGALGDEGIQRKYVAELGSSLADDIFSLPGAGRLRPLFDSHAKAVAKGSGDSAIVRVSSELFSRARKKAYQQHSPILVDYHMDDPVVVRKLVGEAKDNGYETMFASVSVTPETALQRIEARKAATERHTDPGEALRTHKEFATQLPGYFGLFDVGMVFDNNRAYPRLIAMSKAGKMTLLDGEAYEQATAIAKNASQAGGVAGGHTHGHNPGAVAEGHATSAAEGRQSTREGGFAERIADKLQTREPPLRL